jgi:hypothetical protein
MVSMALALLSGGRLVAQDAGGGNPDAAQIQQRIAQLQQRVAQTDPAQLQQLAGQFLPGVAQMDPAQFQQMAQQWQQGMGQLQQRIGQIDPAQLQQMAQPRPTANLRVQLQVTDDLEWSVIETLIQKVLDAQQVIQADHIGSVRGQVNQIAGQMFGAGLARTNPEVQTVGNAVQNEASNKEIQAALTNLKEARKAHLAALEKAQDDLRKVLTLKQEAVATINGLL